MKKIVCLIFALIVIIGIVFIVVQQKQPKEITKTEKISDINDYIEKYNSNNNAILLDVRTREEVKEGKIPNSINIPLDELDNAEFDKTKTIYVYCRSGRRSQMASELLKSKDYNVINIGGISDYKGTLDI